MRTVFFGENQPQIVSVASANAKKTLFLAAARPPTSKKLFFWLGRTRQGKKNSFFSVRHSGQCEKSLFFASGGRDNAKKLFFRLRGAGKREKNCFLRRTRGP